MYSHLEECAACKRNGIRVYFNEERDELVCGFCQAKYKTCVDCAGNGIGDYPSSCQTCHGTGVGPFLRHYIENPKTAGSGIVCCIPQEGKCPIRCADCFFQSGRSYLEPLDVNLPNMPTPVEAENCVVRVNDGNDSNNRPELVMEAVQKYPWRFYNTSIPKSLEKFDAPVVLTVNPSADTDKLFVSLDPPPPNLMFVRFRVNTWNLDLADQAVEYYSRHEIPIVLTFMAYYTDSIEPGYEADYTFRQRTMNSYWVITPEAWDRVMARYKDNKWVYTCGKDANTFACSRCGNCLREYFATMQRLKSLSSK